MGKSLRPGGSRRQDYLECRGLTPRAKPPTIMQGRAKPSDLRERFPGAPSLPLPPISQHFQPGRFGLFLHAGTATPLLPRLRCERITPRMAGIGFSALVPVIFILLAILFWSPIKLYGIHREAKRKPAGGTVTADGQRFIVVTPVEQAQVTELRRRRKTTSATSVI